MPCAAGGPIADAALIDFSAPPPIRVHVAAHPPAPAAQFRPSRPEATEKTKRLIWTAGTASPRDPPSALRRADVDCRFNGQDRHAEHASSDRIRPANCVRSLSAFSARASAERCHLVQCASALPRPRGGADGIVESAIAMGASDCSDWFDRDAIEDDCFEAETSHERFRGQFRGGAAA